jgi:hypothetical protein
MKYRALGNTGMTISEVGFGSELTCPPKTEPVVVLDWRNRKRGE